MSAVRSQVGELVATAKREAQRERREVLTRLRRLNALIADLETLELASGVVVGEAEGSTETKVVGLTRER